jgi:mRNA interferase MazF
VERRVAARGDVWTAAVGPDDAGKPRLVVVIQDDRLFSTRSIMTCPFTTDPAEAPLFRPEVSPNEGNGLQSPSRLVVDKITSMSRTRLHQQIGRLGAADEMRLDRAIFVFLGLAGGRLSWTVAFGRQPKLLGAPERP